MSAGRVISDFIIDQLVNANLPAQVVTTNPVAKTIFGPILNSALSAGHAINVGRTYFNRSLLIKSIAENLHLDIAAAEHLHNRYQAKLFNSEKTRLGIDAKVIAKSFDISEEKAEVFLNIVSGFKQLKEIAGIILINGLMYAYPPSFAATVAGFIACSSVKTLSDMLSQPSEPAAAVSVCNYSIRQTI